MLSSVDNGSMMFMCVGGIPQWKVDQLKGRWHTSWKVGTVQFFYVLLFSLTVPSWWLNQPIWKKMRKSKWIISSKRGETKTNETTQRGKQL